MIGAFALAIWCGIAPPFQGGGDEAEVREAVVRYFDAQGREDADAVVAAWSATAADRPARQLLESLFASGDDQYTVTIASLRVEGNVARVRVSVARVRTIVDGGRTSSFHADAVEAVVLMREAGGWKITSERPVAEELADALIAASPQERARLLAEPGSNDASVRQALARRASNLSMRQRHADSLQIYELILTAARAANDRRDESGALHSIANTLYFQREYVKAGERYQEQLALARGMHDEEAIASASLGIATVAYTRGEYTAALASYREALAIFEHESRKGSIGSTLVGIGNVQFLQAEYDAAAESYRRALGLLQESFDLAGVAMVRAGLGRVFAARGDLASALTMYNKVLDEARARATADTPTPGIDLAATLESIGELHYRLGNTDRARSVFDEARQVSDARHDPESAGRAFASLGLTELVAGKFEAALAAYTSSRARFEAAKDAAGVARAWVGTGFSQTALRRFPEALLAYRTAIASLDARDLDEESARAWLGLSMAQSASGDAAAALDSARHVRLAAATVSGEDLKWRGAVREGEALRKLTRLDEAQHAFEDAIAFIQRILPDVPSSADARTLLDGSGSAWSGLAFTLAQRGDASGALVAEEQRRAHLRRLFLAPFERDIATGSSATDQEQEQRNVRDLISVRAQLRAERTARVPDPVRLDDLKKQVAALSAARSEQQAALYSRLPRLKQLRGLDEVPDATALAALVSSLNALVVEYVVNDEELLILAAAPAEERLDVTSAIVPFDRQQVSARVNQALEPASRDKAAEWRKRSAPLAGMLVEPIAGRLSGHDRVIVLPDDLLWKIPFEALDPGEGDLASRAGVTYGTSLITLAMQRAAARPPSDTEQRPQTTEVAAASIGFETPTASETKMGAIAAPQISDALAAQLVVTSPGWTAPDPVGGVESARRAASAYGASATISSGAEATEASARALLASVDVLQIGAPLQINAASPLFSSVILAGAGDSASTDGRWELREWFSLTSHARTIVIADGAPFAASGGMTMDAFAWAAAAAGASTIAVGRWPSGGNPSDGLLVAWHERMAKSQPPGDALRAAQTFMRTQNGAPGSWALIALIGSSK
jgi:tetratricopeptide (TPR) repeat protein